MSNKVTPCVTIMICVAGCSSTATQDLHGQRSFPAPEFDLSTPPETAVASAPAKQRAKTPQATSDKARKTPKPITVDVPLAVLEEKPPASSSIATKFENVPDAYLKGIPAPAKAPPAKPFFTPLKAKAAEPPAPIKTAEAILQPLIEPAPPETVMLPEPIVYPTYVAVGPEYFGLDSEIAPYVISRAPLSPPLPKRRYVEAEPVAIRPHVLVAQTDRPLVVAGPIMPLPRIHPLRRAPEPNPIPAWEVAALVPARPDPQPRRAPTEPAPRLPARTIGERLSAPTSREDLLEQIERRRTARRLDEPERDSVEDSAPQQPLYRIRISEPEPAATAVASLDPISTVPYATTPPDFSRVTSDELAESRRFMPLPREKPQPRQDGIQIAGTAAGVTTKRVKSITTKPANDVRTPSPCLVNRGSSDRMILVCEGVDVSKSDIFRAVVEGESAFRGLRSFDETHAVIQDYGFNPERFNAMSQGPRSARDLAFLRALRKSGKQIRVKGRSFDLYLMKGDKRLATVLIEQTSEVEMPASIRAR